MRNTEQFPWLQIHIRSCYQYDYTNQLQSQQISYQTPTTVFGRVGCQNWPLIGCIVMLCIHKHIMMRVATIYTYSTLVHVCVCVSVYTIQCHLYAHNNFWYISLDICLSSCMKNTFRSIFHDVGKAWEVAEQGEGVVRGGGGKGCSRVRPVHCE